MGDVVDGRFITRLDVPPERILNGALEAEPKLENVVVIGWDAGGEFYFAGSYASGPETLWLLETARKKLMEIVEDI